MLNAFQVRNFIAPYFTTSFIAFSWYRIVGLFSWNWPHAISYRIKVLQSTIHNCTWSVSHFKGIFAHCYTLYFTIFIVSLVLKSHIRIPNCVISMVISFRVSIVCDPYSHHTSIVVLLLSFNQFYDFQTPFTVLLVSN